MIMKWSITFLASQLVVEGQYSILLIGVAKFGFDFLFGDLFTLFDPEATYGEKLLAVGMMTPYGKGVKIVDKLHDLKRLEM